MVGYPVTFEGYADAIAEMEEEEEEEDDEGMTAEQKGMSPLDKIRVILTPQPSWQHRCRSLEHSSKTSNHLYQTLQLQIHYGITGSMSIKR
jgi:hypothetical protein